MFLCCKKIQTNSHKKNKFLPWITWRLYKRNWFKRKSRKTWRTICSWTRCCFPSYIRFRQITSAIITSMRFNHRHISEKIGLYHLFIFPRFKNLGLTSQLCVNFKFLSSKLDFSQREKKNIYLTSSTWNVCLWNTLSSLWSPEIWREVSPRFIFSGKFIFKSKLPKTLFKTKFPRKIFTPFESSTSYTNFSIFGISDRYNFSRAFFIPRFSLWSFSNLKSRT